MTKDEALKLALEALEDACGNRCNAEYNPCFQREAITAIKEALAQPEQEAVAFINVEQRKLEWAKYMSWDTPTVVNLPKIPLYTTPPQRTWVGLTRTELIRCGVLPFGMSYQLYEAIEAKLKEKNA